MLFERLKIKDCYLITPQIYKDERGFFREIFQEVKYSDFTFISKQVNHSFSHKNVLRGIHVSPFKKLVSCIFGSILDVCVDLRPDSETYKQYSSVILNSENKRQILIPENCGHAFLSLTENTNVVYMQDDFYDSKKESSIIYNDDSLDIDWQIDSKELLISKKDKESLSFEKWEELYGRKNI